MDEKDVKIIKAELQNLQKILEAKADRCIGNGKEKLLSFANACSGALELLKEQEPRILTLDEVKNLKSLYDGAVWLEALTGLFPALPEFCTPGIIFFAAIPLDNYHGHFCNDYYGKTWRCWTSRPTDEQRKAAKWDGFDRKPLVRF